MRWCVVSRFTVLVLVLCASPGAPVAHAASVSFVPPPRAIDDVLAVLGGREVAPAPELAEQRALVAAPLPEAADAATRGGFFYRRGMAALDIGRWQQARDDLRDAARLAAGADYGLEVGILLGRSRVEAQAGDHALSARLLDAARAKLPDEPSGWRLRTLAQMARVFGTRMDIARVETLRAQARSDWDALRQREGVAPAAMKAWEADVLEVEVTDLWVRGRWREAEPLLRRVIAVIESEPSLARASIVDIHRRTLARALLQQGRLLEAEVEARRAVENAIRKQGRHGPQVPLTLRFLTDVLLAQERYREAEALARATVRLFEEIGADRTSLQVGFARQMLIIALSAQRRDAEAVQEWDRLRADIGTDRAAELAKSIRFDVAVALVRAGRQDEAVGLLESARSSFRLLGDASPTVQLTDALLGVARAAQGDTRGALERLRPAMSMRRMDEMPGQETASAATSARRAAILGAYVDTLAAARGTALEREAGIDTVAEAFRVADGARGRAARRAVAAGAARVVAGRADLAELVRTEQDLGLRLGAAWGRFARLVGAPAPRRNEAAIAAAQTDVDDLRAQRAAMTARIAREFPDYAHLIDPPPPTLAAAQAALAPDEALVAFWVGDAHTLVWAVPARGPHVFARVPVGRVALQTMVDALRRGLDPVPGATTLPEFDVTVAHQLYRTLLEPVSAGWRSARRIVVAPHGPLAGLPLDVLVTAPSSAARNGGVPFSEYRAVPWLARTHAVTVVPSVSSLVTLRTLPASTRPRRAMAGFGDPYFSTAQANDAAKTDVAAATAVRGVPVVRRRSPETTTLASATLASLPRLPDTADELVGIARALGADPGTDLFLGRRANEQTVKTTDLERYRILIFATHGLVPGDLDGLAEPALALTAPDVAGVDGDGLLTMGEIFGLRLDADWVVLSACNTASAGASEAIAGLGQAFFYAGARALLVTHWPVETTSARALTTTLFGAHGADTTLDRARALQRAKLALIDGPGLVAPGTKRSVLSYAHPLFWGAFVLVGDGR